MANRLTEIGECNVLLIEGGDEESLFGQIPALASYLQLIKADWQYATTSQGNRSCIVMKNNRYTVSKVNIADHIVYYIT